MEDILQNDTESKVVTTIEKVLPQLNLGQRVAYDTVMTGENTFITGGAGTGKSFLLKSLISCLHYYRKNVMICASTGMAATNIDGVTLHRAFGLSTAAAIKITKTGKHAVTHVSAVLQKTDVVIIDEISMCRMDYFDAVCSSIRSAERKSKHKIQLIVIGDFYQLGPILTNKNNERELFASYYGRKIITPYAFLSDEWRKCNFKTVILSETVRQKDSEFAEQLNKARVGDTSSILYFNTRSAKKPLPEGSHLYSYNANVDAENERCMESRLPDKFWHYMDVIPDLALSANSMAGLPKPVRLKIGARVMICCNDDYNGTHAERDPLDPEADKEHELGSRFHNGSLGWVEDIKEDRIHPDQEYILVRLDNKKGYYFRRREFNVYNYKIVNGAFKKVVVGKYSWIPVRPAYALTIHRAQGQTYEQVNINPDCTNYGQLYVALSRATSISGIHLDRNISVANLRADPEVTKFYDSLENVVSWKMKPVPKAKNIVPARYENRGNINAIHTGLI